MSKVMIPEIKINDWTEDKNNIYAVLYDFELQNGLSKYPKELKKLKVICETIFNKPLNSKYLGGTIEVCVGENRDKEFEKSLHTKFIALKSMSLYDKYLFSKFNELNCNTIFKGLNVTLPPRFNNNIYCIQYQKGDLLKQITMFDFETNGIVLTRIDVRLNDCIEDKVTSEF